MGRAVKTEQLVLGSSVSDAHVTSQWHCQQAAGSRQGLQFIDPRGWRDRLRSSSGIT